MAVLRSRFSFFGGLSTIAPDTLAASASGFAIFSMYNSSTNVYSQASTLTAIIIDTPTYEAIPNSILSNNECDGQQTGTGLVRQNGGALVGTQAAGFMGSVNDGESPTTSKNHWTLGIVDYKDYDGSDGGFTISESAGGMDNNGQLIFFKNYKTAGDLLPTVTATDYTVCMLSGANAGQSSHQMSGARITYRFSSGNLGSGLSKLNYSKPTDADYGLFITSGMDDEEAASVWLANGYGLLVGTGSLSFATR